MVNQVAPGGTVSILLGNGDGTFQPAVGYAAGDNPTMVAVGDFNGDGIPDLAVATEDNYVTGPNVEILLGTGTGGFQAPVGYAAGYTAAYIAVGDFNGDGALDLAVANSTSFVGQVPGTVAVLLNQRGTSIAGATSSPGPSPYHAPVTFNATVAATASGAGMPTGTVTFKDGARTLKKVRLNHGAGSLTVSTLKVGSHTINATYSGNGSLNPHTVSLLTQTVDKDVTTTTPTSSANPSVVGQLVTFTATVASQFGGTVTGMVEFKDGTAILGKRNWPGAWRR